MMAIVTTLVGISAAEKIRCIGDRFSTTGYIDTRELPWYDQVCLAFKLTAQSYSR